MIKLLRYFSVMVCLPVLFSACANEPSPPNYSYENSYERESTETNSARIHTELGAEYFRSGRYETALEEFNMAISKSPSYALAYNGLGLVQAVLGDKAKADASFQRAIQLQPNNSESHNNYGRFLCDNGRYEASIQQFMLAVKNPLYKTPQVAYSNAGVCASRSNNTALAEDYYQKALAIDPQLYTAAYQLANLQFKRGQNALAYQTLQNSVSQSPTPESLGLAVRITRSLNLRDAEVGYLVQLKKLFPNSNEAKLLFNGK